MINNLTTWFNRHYPALLKFCIALLFLDVIIDPSNKIFHVKYILFGGLFLIWLPSLMNKRMVLPKSLSFLLIFVCLFMPLYAISIGLINNFIQNTSMGEVVYLNSFFFFLLLLIIVREKIELTKIFNNSSLFIVLITSVSYLILLYNPKTFGLLYDYFVVEKSAAVYGLRQFGGFTILQIFYKTSPLLIFPLSYFLYQLLIQQNRKHLLFKIVILTVIVITLFLSGTRANILSLALIILFYILFYAYKKSKPVFFILGFTYLLLVIYSASVLSGIFLNKTEFSNMVKFGHFISYIEHFSNYIGVIIFGQGLGGSFYSTGLNSIVNVTELTYFELIRIWGLPITIIFGCILLLPVYKELKNDRISHLFIAYIAYLFIAGTNPLLLSSTGMLVLVYVFSKTYNSAEEKLKTPAIQ